MPEDFLGCLLMILIFVAFVLLGGWVFWVLWNGIVPEVFHGPTISFWQSLGLMALLGCIRGATSRKE